MSIIDLTLMGMDDIPEPTVMDEGSEVELRILEIKLANDRNGNPYILPRFEVVGEPTVKEFTRYLGLPTKSMDEKKLNNAKRALKYFGDAFDIDFTAQVDLNELVGRTGWAILGVEESDEYGKQNFVRRFIRG